MAGSNDAGRRGTPGPVPSHSRRQIATEVVGLADFAGLAAVSVRATATRLGMTPGALYRYFRSKRDLIEAASDRAMEDLVLPSATGDVHADLVALVRAQVDVLQQHPWLIETLPDTRPGPSAIAALERGLLMLAPASAPSARKLELLAMLTGVATLFARSAPTPPSGTIEALLAARATHPHLDVAFAEPSAASSQRDLLALSTMALAQGLLA